MIEHIYNSQMELMLAIYLKITNEGSLSGPLLKEKLISECIIFEIILI
jgi:hypothetical protein